MHLVVCCTEDSSITFSNSNWGVLKSEHRLLAFFLFKNVCSLPGFAISSFMCCKMSIDKLVSHYVLFSFNMWVISLSCGYINIPLCKIISFQSVHDQILFCLALSVVLCKRSTWLPSFLCKQVDFLYRAISLGNYKVSYTNAWRNVKWSIVIIFL